MNFFIMVSLFLSAALGVFRGIDLALLTDAETGLCIVGSVWLRYGALAVAVGAAVAAGRCCKPQTDALRGHCTLSGVVALAAAVCYGEAAVLRILWMGSSVAMLIRAALEALCAQCGLVILEIDPPVDEISIRRKGFYERAGYAENPFFHVHPPYHKGMEGHELVVMSSPSAISPDMFGKFTDYLKNTVMKGCADK